MPLLSFGSQSEWEHPTAAAPQYNQTTHAEAVLTLSPGLFKSKWKIAEGNPCMQSLYREQVWGSFKTGEQKKHLWEFSRVWFKNIKQVWEQKQKRNPPGGSNNKRSYCGQRLWGPQFKRWSSKAQFALQAAPTDIMSQVCKALSIEHWYCLQRHASRTQ